MNSLGAESINTFTRRLKQVRMSRDLSQKELGIKAGFDESGASARMNQYETGKHRPDMNTVKKLCAVLDVPVPYLYCDDDDLAKVIEGFVRLNEADKSRILKIVEKAK